MNKLKDVRKYKEFRGYEKIRIRKAKAKSLCRKCKKDILKGEFVVVSRLDEENVSVSGKFFRGIQRPMRFCLDCGGKYIANLFVEFQECLNEIKSEDPNIYDKIEDAKENRKKRKLLEDQLETQCGKKETSILLSSCNWLAIP